MQSHSGVRRKERADLLRRTDRESVDDEVGRSPAPVRVDDRPRVGRDLAARMPRRRVVHHSANAVVELPIAASRLAARLELLRKTLRPTPHVQLAMKGMNLFAKLEFVNPVGSIKDRAAYWILT